MNNLSLGLKGQVTVQVLRGDGTESEPVIARNLWLDQGLDNCAAMPICDLFTVAVKGTGTVATTEDQTGSANTYSATAGSATLTRSAGTRDFTADDVGRLIRFTDGREFHIYIFTDATHVSITPLPATNITALKATFYYVNQTGLAGEVGRTHAYGAGSGDNGTTTNSNVRTFKRSFIFGTEDYNVETVPSIITYSQSGTTVTRVAPGRDFTSDDLGSTITFTASGSSGKIGVINSASSVTLLSSATNVEGPITITKPVAAPESLPGTYSRSGTTVTRVTGSRDFTSGDIGKLAHFGASNVDCIITAVTDATHATVDTSGTLAAQQLKLYGYADYREIGFSNSPETINNLNIRVVLPSAVRAYPSTPSRSSDQIKVTYQCTLSVSPGVSTAGNLATVISDPGSAMSANKSGNFAIETFATSQVNADGSTNASLVDLEPYYSGTAGWSTSMDALDPFGGKIRNTNLATAQIAQPSYVQGNFTNLYTAVFGLNEAINSAWRSLMLVDADSGLAAFTFLFAANQKKDAAHTFTVSFRKAWNRDLS